MTLLRSQIVAGLHEGFVAATGRRPCFHALGTGTPILLPLLAALGEGRTYTATDSTSPIVDGWSRPTISLYVDSPAPLKYKAYRIAEECRRRDRLVARGGRAVVHGRLARKNVSAVGDVAAARDGRGSEPPPHCAMARVGHDRWVIQRLEQAARRQSETREQLLSWVDEIMRAYLAAPADPASQGAVRVA